MREFAKEKLGLFPTPMHYLPNMSKALGTNVWIKRDDLCGVALGGNKVRKLEYLLADAKAKGYDLVMTTGQAQSNHAMLTAACALRLGLDCILVLKERGVTARKGNQILNHLMGVEVRYMDTDSYEDIYVEMDRIGQELGRKVYKIPCGGSNALGTLGYIDCMKEVADSGIPFDHLVCACGSGGTAAGCVLGAKLHLPETKVMCSMVDNDPFEEIVPALAAQSAALLEGELIRSEDDFQMVYHLGDGYAIPNPEDTPYIEELARLEGILLDPVYTGKAWRGMLKLLQEGYFDGQDNLVFVHTGGAAALFAMDLA